MAILGFVAMLLLIFPGLPSPLRTSFLLALSFAITCLGLAGSRHKAYRPAQSNPASAESFGGPKPIYTEEALIVSTPEEESVDQNL